VSRRCTDAERVSGGWAVDLNNEVKECGYNHCGYCSNEDCNCYWLKCPYKTLSECPVHNEELI
jgi:hypothetical protein